MERLEERFRERERWCDFEDFDWDVAPASLLLERRFFVSFERDRFRSRERDLFLALDVLRRLLSRSLERVRFFDDLERLRGDFDERFLERERLRDLERCRGERERFLDVFDGDFDLCLLDERFSGNKIILFKF